MIWKSKNEIEKQKQAESMERERRTAKTEQDEAIKRFMQFEMDRLIKADELTEEQKTQFLNVYEPFQVGIVYNVGEHVRYKGEVFEVIQEHTSQGDWVPDKTASLFSLFLQRETEEGGEVVHDWEQPVTGPNSLKPYQIDDKVNHKNKMWVSTAANNVWEPGVFGWVEVEEK